MAFWLAWSLGDSSPLSATRIQYSREFLLSWNHVTNLPPNSPSTWDLSSIQPAGKQHRGSGSAGSTWTRKRGRRGGVRLRVKKQSLSRTPLPTIILSNVQSLRNKSEELQAQVRYSHEFRDSCILALTETWLSDRDMDGDLKLCGFGSPVRLDRDETSTGKRTGGGVCLYVNERWYRSIIVRERICTADVELLSVALRPFYLPREFSQLFVTLVYIHPKANSNNACEIISQVTHSLQMRSPDAPIIILGDMNNCSLSKTLRDFHQYVTCPTRQTKTLDLCYCSVKNAFKSIPLPPLGSSDHNCVHLIPSYQTALQRLKPQTVFIEDWSEDHCLALQGCLECTDFDMFKNSCSDIDELTDVISSWVSYCKDTVIPNKAIKVYPNSKPWVTKSLT